MWNLWCVGNWWEIQKYKKHLYKDCKHLKKQEKKIHHTQQKKINTFHVCIDCAKRHDNEIPTKVEMAKP